VVLLSDVVSGVPVVEAYGTKDQKEQLEVLVIVLRMVVEVGNSVDVGVGGVDVLPFSHLRIAIGVYVVRGNPSASSISSHLFQRNI
jgi:hypothetical protein